MSAFIRVEGYDATYRFVNPEHVALVVPSGPQLLDSFIQLSSGEWVLVRRVDALDLLDHIRRAHNSRERFVSLPAINDDD